MMGMGLPRKLLLKLIGSVACAFLVTVAITWLVQSSLADRDAMKVINRVLDDVQGEIRECVNRKLVLTAMVARDRLSEVPDRSAETLRRLADELRVDSVCVVDKDGILVASANPGEVGLDFKRGDEQTKEFLALLDTESELCQPMRRRSYDGTLWKYVGVWLPEGGFVQIGCRESTLRVFAQSSVAGLTHNRHVSGIGTIVITSEHGLVISDAKGSGLEGSFLQVPGDEAYVVKRVIEGFAVYAILPKSAAAVERNTLIGSSAFMTILALGFVAILVGIVISRFVREQVEKRIQADLEMAKTIQCGCLPSIFPPFPEHADQLDLYAMMRTAKEVGGDFYDFFAVGPGRIAVVIADVSGKGVPAAMFMMRAKTAIRSHFESGHDLAEVMGRVNDLLCEGNESSMFVTAWVGIVNLADGLVEFVNAGHNPPLVKRGGQTVEWQRERSGPPLATMAGVRYRVRSMRLSAGDTVFLYTDGVTEATNRSGELWGEARFEQDFASRSCDARGYCEQTLAAIDAYAGEAPQADDITSLVVTVEAVG